MQFFLSLPCNLDKYCMCNSVYLHKIQFQILTALGRNYHPEHFICAVCEQPITGSKFQENDGKPYCEEDYTELFSKRCRACNKPIKEVCH